MKPFQSLLVDDEPPAIELIDKYISRIDQLTVVGKCNSAVKAFDLLQKHSIDLLFLDIRMPLLNGLDFLKTLQNPPAVIITTAYREYAIDGYDLDIIDYLLKPIAFGRFLKAVDRFVQRQNKTTVTITPTPIVESPKFIFFNVNKTHHKVYLKDICYIESLKDYVRIHTIHNPLVVKGNIGSILERMPETEFVRIHRSFVVALSFVNAFNQSEVEVAGTQLPIGGSYRGIFLQKMENLR